MTEPRQTLVLDAECVENLAAAAEAHLRALVGRSGRWDASAQALYDAVERTVREVAGATFRARLQSPKPPLPEVPQ